ncbi:MAG: MBL fold metallo-hydrolase [Kiritimatiellaeota bacterium]|nr:MBL fold metallo-hydrolase [Kiritimatiellota bacterium]
MPTTSAGWSKCSRPFPRRSVCTPPRPAGLSANEIPSRRFIFLRARRRAPCARSIATPGHTPGGVCYHVEKEKALFTGDTLFQGTVGRTDLPGGDGRVLAQSLKKLTVLPPATRVYPGHGPDSTIAEEQRTNIYFRAPAS